MTSHRSLLPAADSITILLNCCLLKSAALMRAAAAMHRACVQHTCRVYVHMSEAYNGGDLLLIHQLQQHW